MSEETSDDPAARLTDDVRRGYTFDGPALELGALMTDAASVVPDARVRVPLRMLNRHGLVAGATGTGKTKTLQLLAEQLSQAGVPVFAADIKGDLSGLLAPGEASERVAQRMGEIGQDWTATGYPVELYALGGEGTGVPLRASVSSFGPLLLSKVLGLNQTQESSLGLVFHHADKAGLPLLDLADLQALLRHLTSDEGKAELKGIGGISTATAGVILRNLVTLETQGADRFFGEPEFEPSDLMRTAEDGRGVISLLELPSLQNRPALFSTFLMWLLADLFHSLPEVGDPEKPSLVFFFDEAHLLFDDASDAFLDQVAQTVRLIRSKGVGIFFVTQSPTDVPDEVLAQLGSRVQHALRAHTPKDAKALKAAVSTYPHSGYDDLGRVLTSLGTGEAVVTVIDERGAPSPVAWTMLRAPQSLMSPADPAAMEALVATSPRQAAYGTPIDRESAREKLAARLEQAAEKVAAEEPAEPAAPRSRPPSGRRIPVPRTTVPDGGDSTLEKVVSSPVFKDAVRTAAREIVRGMFGAGRR